MDPVVKSLTCAACGKPTEVRVMPSATSHVYHCPHCKKSTTAQS